MKKKMCMTLNMTLNRYKVLVIPPELYLQLSECAIYKCVGWGDNRVWTLTDDNIEVELVHLPDTLEEIQDRALENNRLVCENEKLKEELAKLKQSYEELVA